MKQIKPNTLFFKKIKKIDLLIYLLSLLTPMHKPHKNRSFNDNLKLNQILKTKHQINITLCI